MKRNNLEMLIDNQIVFSKEKLMNETEQRGHFDDITIKVSLQNDKNGIRKSSICLSRYNLEDIVQVMVLLNELILEDENIHLISGSLLDLGLEIMPKSFSLN